MPIYHVKFDICNCKLICLGGNILQGGNICAHLKGQPSPLSVPLSAGQAAKLLGQKVAYFKIQLKTDKSLSLNANTFTCATPTGAQSKFTFATSRVACNIGKSAKST